MNTEIFIAAEDVTAEEILRLSQMSKSFEFFADPKEDVYAMESGELI